LDKLPELPELVIPLLKSDGWFVLEHGKDHDFTNHPHWVETRQYGSVHFSFFQ
ncbi:MAG: 16S rRNA (guanine(966)-N(2))-methyltransferase RsmD, partial [Paludibacteraceae bacterium]|nr:16S rRNA (guanine(966)-N(2))-methyltransferase RsmD [Paludibacteraceae bacterium]